MCANNSCVRNNNLINPKNVSEITYHQEKIGDIVFCYLLEKVGAIARVPLQTEFAPASRSVFNKLETNQRQIVLFGTTTV